MTKGFSEINMDNLSTSNSWCVAEGDNIKVLEKDDTDDDDLILEVKFTKALLLQEKHIHTKAPFHWELQNTI